MSLITTTEEIKKYISVNMSTEIRTIKPYIKQAETKFIRPLLGDLLFARLQEYYNGSGSSSSSSGSAIMDELLEKVQLPLIYYAYHLYAPIGAVMISDSGIHISVHDNKKTAFEWQVDKVEKSILNTAFDFSEYLLEWLETEIDEFEEWFESDAYTESHDLFINKAKDFNKEFEINNSRLLFVKLKPIIKSIENKFIVKTISSELAKEIKSQIVSGKVKDKNQLVLDLIKPALAHLTMARALTELSVDILPDAVSEKIIGTNITMNAKNAVSPQKLYALKEELTNDGNAEIKALQEFLDNNADDYLLYKDSSIYKDPVTTTNRGEFVNSKDKGIFVV